MSTDDPTDHAAARAAEAIDRLEAVRGELRRVVIGQEAIVDQLLVGLIGGGHVLVEGAPGLGKTLLVRSLSTAFGLRTSRIQFTPDLMPGDITGANVLVSDERGSLHPRFEPGPIFAQLVLADEINRATPRTQSALLEAMQESTVTVAGEERPLPRPFFVMATQNPIEMEGTYVLPEAQVDRFFLKAVVSFPSEETLDAILDFTTGEETVAARPVGTAEDVLHLQELARSLPVASHVRRAVARFVVATHPDRTRHEGVRRNVQHGVSPRGAQAWLAAAKAHALLEGRSAVGFDDLEAMLAPALRHRLILGFEAHDERFSLERLLRELFDEEVASIA